MVRRAQQESARQIGATIDEALALYFAHPEWFCGNENEEPKGSVTPIPTRSSLVGVPGSPTSSCSATDTVDSSNDWGALSETDNDAEDDDEYLGSEYEEYRHDLF